MDRHKKFWIFTIILIISVITSIIVVIKRYVPESKAEEESKKSIKVTYKSGIENIEDVVVNQTLSDSQTCGDNDYTDGKIVFYRNGKNGINFLASQIEYNKTMYDRILTGWKLTSVVKNGTEITNFIEPTNQNYADKTNANKDIGTVYAQEGWYIVPDGVTEITVEAVYARAIYVRSPYDKMYYDEYHVFYYGENSDKTTTLDETAIAKSSDDNDGSTVEKAVSTLNRAYSLMTESRNLTVYDTAFVLCGDMYEINYVNGFSKYATGKAGTYTNYSSPDFGYNSSFTKPVTITNIGSYAYKIYTGTPSYDYNNYSSLRLDNIYMGVLPIESIKKVHLDTSDTKGTYVRRRQFNFYNPNAIFETTETVKNDQDTQIRYNSMRYMKINGGFWNPVQSYSVATVTLSKKCYIYVGGMSKISYVSIAGASNENNVERYITNSINIVVTGGKISEGIYGSSRAQGGNINGNVNMFVSGGYVANVYGSGNGSIYQNGEEIGDVNIEITGGTFGNIYGGGQYYTSKISGNVNIKIKNAKIDGNIYGGGKGGQVCGNVYIDIKKSVIQGNCYGGGLGLTDSIYYTKVYVASIMSNGYENIKKLYNNAIQNKNTVKWEEAPNGFPSYNKETAEVTGRIFHNHSTANASYIFVEKELRYFLSLASIKKDITMNIEDSTIEKNIYGGGSIGLVEGNVKLTIKNTDVKGNIYGGGDGKTVPSKVTLYAPIQEYKELTSAGTDNNTKIGDFTWTNDEDILKYFKGIYDGKNKVIYNLDNTTTEFGELPKEAQTIVAKYGTEQLVYSSDVEKLGYVEGNITVNIEGGTYRSTIYGGGNNGQVKGKVELKLANISGKNIYTGGNTGKVEKDTSVIIDSGIYENVFGGGYSGEVLGNSTVQIRKGTFTNIFGGGYQSYILGKTDVTIGNEEGIEKIKVTGIVYGGGRGYDADNDGDASDFTTVYGSSNVLIQGINTFVENYGSIKLGAVSGNVDVSFKNYWSGNSTAKYKKMNGIDRATTVSFENSYVLLENKDTTGNLKGIQAIKDINIPKGSGLKISAEGEITGNFNGGGELYLDSLVCLKVMGNITGKTTLIINPKLMEDGMQGIKGGINVPYLKVAGNAPDEIALISGENNKYVIIQANKDVVEEVAGEKYIYYYIARDVTVENNITIENNSIEGRNYKEEIDNTKDILIQNTGVFTTDINVSYYLTDDAYKAKDYSNITRNLKLISNTDESKSVVIPINTEIAMIIGNDFYSYVVKKENLSEINLSEFVKADGGKYDELKNITNSDLVDKSLNEINGTTTYTFKENYKFIFNFSNTKGIEEDRYYPSFEIYYGQSLFENEKKNVANSIIDAQKRKYDLKLISDKKEYEQNDIINFTGNLKINSLKENTVIQTKDLYIKLRLEDSDENNTKIPNGTKIKINSQDSQIQNGEVIFKLLDNINTASSEQNIEIQLDMSGSLPQNMVQSGTYKVIIEYLNSKQYEKIAENDLLIIDNQTEYGLETNINEMEGIELDKIQLIENGKEEKRNIKINCSNISKLKNMKIKIKAVERTNEFEYIETENSKNKIDIETKEINLEEKSTLEKDVTVTFNKEAKLGTYRIIVELYDEYEKLRTYDYVNFIVS